MASRKMNNSSTFYLVKYYILFNGIMISSYAILSLIVFNLSQSFIFFPSYVYWIIRQLFFNFNGFLWLQIRYSQYLDFNLISLFLLIIGTFLIIFAFFNKAESRINSKSSIVPLLVLLSFPPFGLLSIFLIYKQFENIDETSVSQSSAINILINLALNYFIAYGLLIFAKSIMLASEFKYEIFLTFSIVLLSVLSIVHFLMIGQNAISGIKRNNISFLIGIITLLVVMLLLLVLYNFYNAIHKRIDLLAPVSIFIIINVIYQYLLLAMNKDTFIGENYY